MDAPFDSPLVIADGRGSIVEISTAQQLADVWRSVSRWNVFPLNLLTGFFGFFGARDHLVSDRGLRKLVADNIEVGPLEDSPVPLHVITTDLLSGRELRLSRGDMLDAVIASAAIPGCSPPSSAKADR